MVNVGDAHRSGYVRISTHVFPIRAQSSVLNHGMFWIRSLAAENPAHHTRFLLLWGGGGGHKDPVMWSSNHEQEESLDAFFFFPPKINQPEPGDDS